MSIWIMLLVLKSLVRYVKMKVLSDIKMSAQIFLKEILIGLVLFAALLIADWCKQSTNGCILSVFLFRIFMIFEKLDGGTLLHNIWRRGLLREHDVSEVVKDIADGLFFLHQKGKI